VVEQNWAAFRVADPSETGSTTSYLFAVAVASGRTDISAKALQNRLLLLGLMTAAGWQTLPTEWWHFQLPGDWTIVVPADGQTSVM
jgi:D-alanyl-D-alanine dipeptidase